MNTATRIIDLSRKHINYEEHHNAPSELKEKRSLILHESTLNCKEIEYADWYSTQCIS